jgi:hypothetical protein
MFYDKETDAALRLDRGSSNAAIGCIGATGIGREYGTHRRSYR